MSLIRFHSIKSICNGGRAPSIRGSGTRLVARRGSANVRALQATSSHVRAHSVHSDTHYFSTNTSSVRRSRSGVSVHPRRNGSVLSASTIDTAVVPYCTTSSHARRFSTNSSDGDKRDGGNVVRSVSAGDGAASSRETPPSAESPDAGSPSLSTLYRSKRSQTTDHTGDAEPLSDGERFAQSGAKRSASFKPESLWDHEAKSKQRRFSMGEHGLYDVRDAEPKDPNIFVDDCDEEPMFGAAAQEAELLGKVYMQDRTATAHQSAVDIIRDEGGFYEKTRNLPEIEWLPTQDAPRMPHEMKPGADENVRGLRSPQEGDTVRFRRRCGFCASGEAEIVIDSLNMPMMMRYMSGIGDIRPRKRTGVCAKHQRKLARAIKRARHLGIFTHKKSEYRVHAPAPNFTEAFENDDGMWQVEARYQSKHN